MDIDLAETGRGGNPNRGIRIIHHEEVTGVSVSAWAYGWRVFRRRDSSAWDIDERIHPLLKQHLAAKAPRIITSESLPALRKALTVPAETLPKNERVIVHNEFLPSGLRVRVYTPKAEKAEYPALLWIHGGWHIMGSPEGNEALLLRIAEEIGCIVAAPAYRQTPENPYPADLDDCYSALVWMTENLPVRKDRVAVAGQSAGGGLTAALALRARDSGGPVLCFQMPLYPMLDCRNITPSTYQICDHRACAEISTCLRGKCTL
ncbi:MAG: alpha/beta hydrolase fold domain-containing protein [Synergistaceae bacterium]|nr:alpha/beta hydrolase fold domain-containing protein [Synergistaceae bacterium]